MTDKIKNIAEKYNIGDDAFSKAANETYHHAAKFKGQMRPDLNKRLTSLEIMEKYSKANDFKNAGIAYRPASGWAVLVKRSSYVNPTEAQAIAQDILKAVAAIKKAPAFKK